MIPENIKQSLMKNWGDKAEAMDCFAEVNLMSDDARWNYYVYAMNPDDEDEACMIVYSSYNDYIPFNICYLLSHISLNVDKIDPEFRRMKANELFKKLQGRT